MIDDWGKYFPVHNNVLLADLDFSGWNFHTYGCQIYVFCYWSAMVFVEFNISSMESGKGWYKNSDGTSFWYQLFCIE